MAAARVAARMVTVPGLLCKSWLFACAVTVPGAKTSGFGEESTLQNSQEPSAGVTGVLVFMAQEPRQQVSGQVSAGSWVVSESTLHGGEAELPSHRSSPLQDGTASVAEPAL